MENRSYQSRYEAITPTPRHLPHHANPLAAFAMAVIAQGLLLTAGFLHGPLKVDEGALQQARSIHYYQLHILYRF